MSSSEYLDVVLEYLQSRGWRTDLTELREGVYIIIGAREQDADSEKIMLMTVYGPEQEVTSKHVEYLLKAGRKKNADSVLLTYTSGITESAEKIVEKSGLSVIDSEEIHSYTEAPDPGDDNVDNQIYVTRRAPLIVGVSLIVLVVLFVPNGVPIVTDSDGVSVYQEFTSGTNPLVADTDGDGLSDKTELQGPTDPTVEDTDFDDLNDSEEINYGTDPTKWDTDGDGIADGTEVKRNDELLPGADPLRKNIYIEIDYMESHQISNNTEQQIKQMFASSPVENPDGSTGIDLYIKRSNKVESQSSTTIDDYSRIREQNADYYGKGYFYVLLVNNVAIPRQDNDGRENYRGAGLPGRMFLRGDLPDRQMRLVFTHEMGHMLGLRSSVYQGIDSTEVPYQHYQSVMNYNVPRDGYTYSGEESRFNDWEYIEKRMVSPSTGNTNASE